MQNSRPVRTTLSILTTIVCALPLWVGTANAQSDSSSWGAEPTDSRTQANGRNSNRVFDEDSFSGYEKYQGPYAQFGVAVGSIDYDGPVDVDGGGGFSLTGGYRILPWLSAEANITYLGGADAEIRNRNVSDAEFFSITFGPKFYPIALIEDAPIPEFVQPYALVGIGGGEFEIGSRRGGENEQSSFIARFIFGTDIWFTDQFGAYVEGGYHAAADDDIDGAGVFTIGGQIRF